MTAQIVGPHRSRPLRMGIVASFAGLVLLAAACVVDARLEGGWGSISMERGRLNLFWGRPFPLARYQSHVHLRPTRPDPAIDFHSYPATPATGTAPSRAAWWFVRAPLWIPVVVFGLPTLVYWVMLVRRRPAWACRRCGYDLRGLKAEECPECGRGIEVSSSVGNDTERSG